MCFKKMMQTICAVMLCVGMLCGCGDSSEVSIQTMKDAAVEDYVTLPEDYRAIKVTVSAPIQVSDGDVESYIQNMLRYDEDFRRYSGTVAQGDQVNIDYEGSIGGVNFQGGTAKDRFLTIGSHTFIPGFEDGLVGVGVGENVELNLQFPENYGTADLAGKDVVFKVTVNYILDTLTDENVHSLDEGYSDLASYKADVRTTLEFYAENQYKYDVRNAVSQAVVNGSTFQELPKTLIADYSAALRKEYTNAAKTSGKSLQEYMQEQYYIAEADLDSAITKMGEQCAREGLVLQLIANKEGLNITDEKLNETMNELLQGSSYDSVEAYLKEKDQTMEDLRLNLMYQAVYEFLVENAVVENI